MKMLVTLISVLLLFFTVILTVWRVGEIEGEKEKMIVDIEDQFYEWAYEYSLEIEILRHIFSDPSYTGSDYRDFYKSVIDERLAFWNNLSLYPELLDTVLIYREKAYDDVFLFNAASSSLTDNVSEKFRNYIRFVETENFSDSMYPESFPLYFPEEGFDYPFILQKGEVWSSLILISPENIMENLFSALMGANSGTNEKPDYFHVRILTGGSELTRRLLGDKDLPTFSMTYLSMSSYEFPDEEDSFGLPDSLKGKNELKFAVSYRGRMVPEIQETVIVDDAQMVSEMFHTCGTGIWAVLEIDQKQLFVAAVKKQLGQLLFIYAALATLAVLFFTLARHSGNARRLVKEQMGFVANVTHELRTPLAAICNAGSNIEQGFVTAPGKFRQYGTLISSEGKRLADMVDSILLYSGMMAGNEKCRPVELDLLLPDILRTSGFICEQKNLEFRTEVETGIIINGDRDGIQSAIRNLIDNAVIHGGSGGLVDLKIARKNSKAVIVVGDRGPGIDDSETRKIFTPFYRGKLAGKLAVPGSGLGLSLVKKVAEVHGGRLYFSNRKGAGVVFTLELPVSEEPGNE